MVHRILCRHDKDCQGWSSSMRPKRGEELEVLAKEEETHKPGHRSSKPNRRFHKVHFLRVFPISMTWSEQRLLEGKSRRERTREESRWCGTPPQWCGQRSSFLHPEFDPHWIQVERNCPVNPSRQRSTSCSSSWSHRSFGQGSNKRNIVRTKREDRPWERRLSNKCKKNI